MGEAFKLMAYLLLFTTSLSGSADNIYLKTILCSDLYLF